MTEHDFLCKEWDAHTFLCKEMHPDCSCLTCKHDDSRCCLAKDKPCSDTGCPDYEKETATTSAKAVAAKENIPTPIIDAEYSEVKEANYD